MVAGPMSDWRDEIEHRWEIRRGPLCHVATWISEIRLTPDRAMEDTMAPIECVGEVFPWTLSTFTRRGLERRMRRWERKHNFVGERVEV